MQTVEVTGIRASLAKSLNVKKNSSANVEVITAEDVGKMPDKNLADSLQRLAGVAVRTDYDEAEKVSMRGTNPDMSLILFNGHTVSGGDWYVADQGSSSRSTSLSLMPSSVLNQAIVYKTSQANIADGGLAGTINVTTRKPLSQKEKFSGVVSVGAAYAAAAGQDHARPERQRQLEERRRHHGRDRPGLQGKALQPARFGVALCVRRQQRLGRDQHGDHEGHHRRNRWPAPA